MSDKVNGLPSGRAWQLPLTKRQAGRHLSHLADDPEDLTDSSRARWRSGSAIPPEGAWVWTSRRFILTTIISADWVEQVFCVTLIWQRRYLSHLSHYHASVSRECGSTNLDKWLIWEAKKRKIFLAGRSSCLSECRWTSEGSFISYSKTENRRLQFILTFGSTLETFLTVS